MPRSKFDPVLRARFEEVAREIILRDRRATKRGRSQNTIGEIERALRGRDVLVGLTYRHDRIDVTNPVGLRRVSEGQLPR